MVLSAFEQMHRQKGSLVSLFDASQLPALSRVCTVRRLAEGEKLMRQGEVATFLGFVMTGRLKVCKPFTTKFSSSLSGWIGIGIGTMPGILSCTCDWYPFPEFSLVRCAAG